MPSGLLYCLLFMLTSADIIPQPKFAAGLRMDDKVDTKLTLSACEKLGGECFHRRKDCPDILPVETEFGKPYCNSRKERCCYPVPKPTPEAHKPTPEECQRSGECFFLYASNQCFCFLENNATNWEAADGICKGLGWQLPHPTDVVALRAGLFQECGDCGDFWMNAGWHDPQVLPPTPCVAMCWNDVDVQIFTTNPYFAPAFPALGPGICLVMRVKASAMVGAELGKPYYSESCTDTTNHKHILCEKVN